jgi:hypothetical protein
MKRTTLSILGCILAVNMALAAEPSAADQKWITVVEKMVSEGKSTIATPSKDRVELLKEWAKNKGYSIEVSSNDKGFQAAINTSRKLVSK